MKRRERKTNMLQAEQDRDWRGGTSCWKFARIPLISSPRETNFQRPVRLAPLKVNANNHCGGSRVTRKPSRSPSSEIKKWMLRGWIEDRSARSIRPPTDRPPPTSRPPSPAAVGTFSPPPVFLRRWRPAALFPACQLHESPHQVMQAFMRTKALRTLFFLFCTWLPRHWHYCNSFVGSAIRPIDDDTFGKKSRGRCCKSRMRSTQMLELTYAT
jgi:hypothetical protein